MACTSVAHGKIVDTHDIWRRLVLPQSKNETLSCWYNVTTGKTQIELPDEMREHPAPLSEVDELRTKLDLVKIKAPRFRQGMLVHPFLRGDSCNQEQWYEDVPITVSFITPIDTNALFPPLPLCISLTPILRTTPKIGRTPMVTCYLFGRPTANGFQFCIRTSTDAGADAGFSRIVPESLVEAVQWIAIA
jgi:hypothetical protein